MGKSQKEEQMSKCDVTDCMNETTDGICSDCAGACDDESEL